MADDGVIRPIADVLRDFGGGATADEASAALAELVRAVQATGRKGTLTIKIDVAPMKNTTDMLIASASVTAKPPADDPVAAVFFSTDAGSLVRDDPRQQALFDRPVRAVTGKIGDTA